MCWTVGLACLKGTTSYSIDQSQSSYLMKQTVSVTSIAISCWGFSCWLKEDSSHWSRICPCFRLLQPSILLSKDCFRGLCLISQHLDFDCLSYSKEKHGSHLWMALCLRCQALIYYVFLRLHNRKSHCVYRALLSCSNTDSLFPNLFNRPRIE